MCSTRNGQGKESKVMTSWTDEETFKLIELWSEDSIQVMLEGSRRNRDEYEIAYETPALRVLLRSSTGSVEVGHVSHGEKLQPFFTQNQ